MRLPLQSTTSSGGALKPSVARYSNVLMPQTNQMKHVGIEEKVYQFNGSIDDENAENQPEMANMGGQVGKNVDEGPMREKELSLVERRAALFDNVHHKKKKTRVPKQVKVDTITTDENGINEDISSSDPAQLAVSPIEEYVSTSPTEEAAPTADVAPPVAPSPSHMDFASKKKAIFNFSKQSTSYDSKLIKDGSHFETKKDSDVSDKVDIKVRKNEDCEDNKTIELSQFKSFESKKWESGFGGNERVPDEEDAVAEKEVLKCPNYVESPAQQFLSPPPGTTTTAVYSPSPHLLKPSQMNLKTYSGDLFRVAAAHAGSSKVIDETESCDVHENVDEAGLGKEDVFSMMNKLSQKYSSLVDFTSNKYANEVKTLESPQSPVAATPEAKAVIESSPTPHLLRPSQMNFKSAYTDNLFRKTSAPAARDKDSAKPPMTEKQADFASRFSDVQSPSDFPTKFSDIVSPQTSSSIDFSPTLTRFLYLSQRDSLGDTNSEKKIAPKEVVTDIDNDEELISQSEQVFSPLNAQMLSDMIGFASSFSEAIVSPRENIKSPTVMARAKPSCIGIDTQSCHEKDHFTDFASFSSSNFGGDEASGRRSSTSIADKVKFFDSSPFGCGSDAKFPSPGNVNRESRTSGFTEMMVAKEEEEKFAVWDMATTEAPADNPDESEDDLGRELDNILAIAADEEPLQVSNNDLEENNRSENNAIFFGNRFNEDLAIMRSPGSQNENLSTIDETDEDLAACTKLFKESLSPELSEFYTQINSMFDRKVDDLEKRVKSATVENSVIKEEMCAQHQQIQGLMMQLESSRDMMQANQCLMEEIEELKTQLAQQNKGRGKFKFLSVKKKKINWL